MSHDLGVFIAGGVALGIPIGLWIAWLIETSRDRLEYQQPDDMEVLTRHEQARSGLRRLREVQPVPEPTWFERLEEWRG